MKRKLLSGICCLSLISPMIGQITVDRSDFGNIDDTVHMAIDQTLNGITAGSSGANQVWNFKGLQVDGQYDYIFNDATKSTAAATFPGSDISIYDGQLERFVTTSADSMQLNGVFGNSLPIPGLPPFAVKYTDPQLLLKFPLTYLDSFTDTTYFTTEVDVKNIAQINALFDAIKIVRNSSVTVMVDGHGDVHLITDTFPSIRLKTVQYSVDSLYGKYKGQSTWTVLPKIPGYIPANPVMSTVTTYSWIAKAEKNTLLELVMDSAGTTPTSANFVLKPNLAAGLTTSTSANCFADCDGEASVVAIGGVAPFTYKWDANANNQSTDVATGLCKGTYMVTVADAVGDTAMATVTVGEPAVIEMPFKIVSATCDTCKNGSAEALTKGGTTPYTYNWANGQTTKSITGITKGSYTVTVTDGNGCTSTATATVGAWPVGIDESYVTDLFSFYPNPAENSFFVKTNSTAKKEIELYNLLGASVYKTNSTENLIKINLESIDKGIYMIKVTENNSSVTKKLIVK